MINTVIIQGNLTRDPEFRYLPSGKGVCELAVAYNRKWRTESGEEREAVSFFNCTAFGKTAEAIAKYFGKGRPILIEGQIEQQSWDDKETGKKRSAVKILVNGFHFCGGERKGEGAAATTAAAAESGSRGATSPTAESLVDDVPF